MTRGATMVGLMTTGIGVAMVCTVLEERADWFLVETHLLHRLRGEG